jgi:hypothetical protein
MRLMFAVALLALPATAFAQMYDGRDSSIPVTKCDPFSGGSLCVTLDRSGLHAAQSDFWADRDRLATISMPARRLSGG